MSIKRTSLGFKKRMSTHAHTNRNFKLLLIFPKGLHYNTLPKSPVPVHGQHLRRHCQGPSWEWKNLDTGLTSFWLDPTSLIQKCFRFVLFKGPLRTKALQFLSLFLGRCDPQPCSQVPTPRHCCALDRPGMAGASGAENLCRNAHAAAIDKTQAFFCRVALGGIRTIICEKASACHGQASYLRTCAAHFLVNFVVPGHSMHDQLCKAKLAATAWKPHLSFSSSS